MIDYSHCCIVVTCDHEARLAVSEEQQQRLLQVVEQWKKMFNARGIQISQLQNETKQLQDKCECMCIKLANNIIFGFVHCSS